MLTQNEKKILKFLLFSFGEAFSINEISRKCKMTPNGAFKILKKFEKQGIFISNRIANIKSYKINFKDLKTKNVLGIALVDEIKGKIKNRYKDIEPLKEISECCILFGSYINKDNPNDLDLIFIIKKNKLEKYREIARKIYPAMPIKVHEIIQTKEDFFSNIKIKDPVIIQALKKSLVLWGYNIIIEAIENADKR